MPNQASAPRAPSGVSVETQTQERGFPVLPTSFLELPRLTGTALSYQSIGPFDLQLEREHVRSPPEGGVEVWIEEARKLKREGDAQFARNNKVWSIRSLSKYVSSALLFMESAEAMVRERHRLRHSNPAGLYGQTAKLLNYTVGFADTLKGNGIGKEALRLLAERLQAICLLRQTSLMLGNFRSVADKAQTALKEHSRQQAAAAHGAGAGSAAAVGPQPSPEDSSASTLPAHAASAPAAAHPGSPASLPGFPPERVSELLEYAKTTMSFTDAMKRSCKSFEAFVERADVRQDQQAKLVCMHLAAVCMDMGMAGGLRVIHHAREAIRTMCDDLAR
ncbi:hypothetical protein GPECTOR_99g802 [Gonium pectorale]|uniref:AF4/FMR2 C-terminal homology domain-containing protein n=1 Tax=Gonium pectorale TaxID=33097 RepID=A0A150G001_GONPE|nr:hypothetical protein GPECTOR_99g802 [Gonium pectorale]|eukprot:KXZ43167.1 hypothetical protein GPECTOR_99g802 [Gonium pectorale]